MNKSLSLNYGVFVVNNQKLIEVRHKPCDKVMNLVIKEIPPSATLVCQQCGKHTKFNIGQTIFGGQPNSIQES